jgi:hypothetical protein
MANILVVYYFMAPYPPRATVKDHLYALKRYSGHNVCYLNAAVSGVPDYVRRVKWDLIVFHTIFMALRWNRTVFRRVVQKMAPLRDLDAVKVIMPQDEFLNTDLVCEFIKTFDIQCVFSVSPASEWPKIYRDADFTKVKFYTVLTGYLDEDTVQRIEALAQTISERPIDIGYRVWHSRPWLGRFNLLKTQLADIFARCAPGDGLKVDISTRSGDMFLGDDWYRFLLRCKYTVGVEGGASILDYDGTIRQRVEKYLVSHPKASFDEVETVCFPGIDGNLSLFAISPRHLEACATRTCQVLIEGDYNGVLAPNRHYIPLKADFSNLAEVLAVLKADDRREEITRCAYEEIVASEQHTYARFVQFILEKSLGPAACEAGASTEDLSEVVRRMDRADEIAWAKTALYTRTVLPLKRQMKTLLRRAD